VLKFIVIGIIVLLVLWAVGMYNGLIKPAQPCTGGVAPDRRRAQAPS